MKLPTINMESSYIEEYSMTSPKLKPATLQEKKQGPRIFLVRNATSIHDYWSKTYSRRARRYKGDPQPEKDPNFKFLESVQSKWDTRLLDPSLHPIGIKEATEARKFIDKTNIKYVFVSPMRRTLETCAIMLGEYPNKENLKIEVHPLLRNIIGNAKDIPYHSISKAEKEYQNINGLHFNFHLLKEDNQHPNDLFFVESMNSPDKEKILAAVYKNPNTDYAKTIIEIAKEKRRKAKKGQRKLETYENMRQRAVKIGEFLENFVIKTHVKPDEDILIVTHGPVIRYCQSIFWGPDGRALSEKVDRCFPVEFDYGKLLELESQFKSGSSIMLMSQPLVPLGPAISPQLGAMPSPLYYSMPIPETTEFIAPLQTCALGHQLFFSRSANSYDHFDCHKCLRGGKCAAGRWNCIYCKYDLCTKCKPAPSYDELKKLCPNGHKLSTESPDQNEEMDNDFICSKCKHHSITIPGQKRLCCLACSYDLCPNCS